MANALRSGVKGSRAVLWFTLALFLSAAFYYSLYRFFDHDEFYTVHAAWKILHGERVYRDFLELHHPLVHFMLAPLIYLFGEGVSTLIAFRVLFFAQFIAIVAVTYLTAERLFGSGTGVVAAVLLAASVHFLHKAIEIRPDVPQVLTGLIAVYFLFSYFESKKTAQLLCCGFFLALSFLFMQKAVFLVFFVEVMLLTMAVRKEVSGSALLLHLAVIAATMLPFYLYLALTGSLGRYAEYNWLIHARTLEHYSAFAGLADSFRLNYGVWVIYAAGLVYCFKDRLYRRFAILSIALFSTIFVVRVPNPQYIMASMPLIAIVAAYGLSRVFARHAAVAAAVVIVSIASPAYFLATSFTRDNSGQLDKISYVLSVTAPADYVYDGNVLFNLYRKDIDFFWYRGKRGVGVLDTYRLTQGYVFDACASIERYKPKVVSSEYIDDVSDPRISAHYVRSDVFDDLLLRRD